MENNSNPKTNNSGLFDALFGYAILMTIAFIFVWNWDGFWQTNIRPLENVQQKYFPSKFKQEQLKISRIEKNNEYFAEIESRLELAESELAKQKLNCAYYKTSLRVIVNLKRSLSEDELSKIKKLCSNDECDQIFDSEPKVQEICS